MRSSISALRQALERAAMFIEINSILRSTLPVTMCFGLFCGHGVAAEPDFARDVLPLLEANCFGCHADEEQPEGGLNLERFTSERNVLADRAIWKSVFDKVESRQMPPPKESWQPTDDERASLLAWITNIAARPDPTLGARDPGKSVMRRITRLEYNNTVRDLLGLDTDIFMFSERLPLADKSYFQPSTGRLGDHVEIRLREYGARYPVLLPQGGLPGDNRAEHGFRNRGDAMNFSPLLFEQYVTLAGEIVDHPDLPRRSPVFAELLGVEFNPLPSATSERGKVGSTGSLVSPAVGVFAPNVPKPAQAGDGPDELTLFRERLAEAFGEGRGGVFDVALVVGNTTVAGKGALVRVPFGDSGAKTLTINPNADLWLVSFATAEETSGTLLVTNKVRKEKQFELTFRIEDGDHDERITQLAVCVVGRSGQSGPVTLTAKFSDGTESNLTAMIDEGASGTTFFHFTAVSGEHVKSLIVDGARFSGDYLLLDDLGFVTSGKGVPNARPPAAQVPLAPKKDAHITKDALIPKEVVGTTASRSEPKSTPRPTAERLGAFVERAFRRPVDSNERALFQNLFDAARNSGKSEADAMRVTVQAVLSSPGFLFLAEPLHPGTPGVRPLDDFEIASRLSYFLWASMPDDDLIAAAQRGELRTPAGLEAQTLRMLRDPRARELSESFAVQWLRLDQLYTSKPDNELFKSFYSGPQGKDTLHGAALTEALLLFETVLVEDRTVLDLIDADYTWLNPRLARLYGMTLDPNSAADVAPVVAPGQTNRELKKDDKDANNHWQRVTLSDKARGGVLTMAGPLTVTSLPFRTSPVKRGAWLLETIFNRPPQEPKVAFVIENDTKQASRQLSVRQRFEAHRSEAACFSCHVRLDPPGFALERFDAIGGWRDTDGGQAVDARGEWNGNTFDGPAEFKAMLAARPDEFTRGLIEHLLSYALGRKLEIYDMPAVAEIQRSAAMDDHRFSRVIAGVVTSYPFRHARGANGR